MRTMLLLRLFGLRHVGRKLLLVNNNADWLQIEQFCRIQIQLHLAPRQKGLPLYAARQSSSVQLSRSLEGRA